MNRLLYFLLRYQTGLLFTVLLFIGFALFAYGADYHRAWYFNRVGKATFGLHSFRENVLRPGKYARENRALIEENAELKAMKFREIRILVPSNDPRAVVKDVDTSKYLSFHPAKVIYSTLNRRDNVILIDRGSNDGIEKHMVVMDARGVVGLVSKTMDNTALIATVMNERVQLNGRIESTSEKGVVQWNYGLGSDKALLTEIPHKSNISEGDVVTTYGPIGKSNVPGGIPVGTISTIRAAPSGNYLEAELKLKGNLEQLSYVYCIEVKESAYLEWIEEYGDQ
jgi:rod shape-determining protein MreC